MTTSKFVTFTNSVFSQVTNLAGYPANNPSPTNFVFTNSAFNGFYASTNFGSDVTNSPSYPFQAVGAAGYYLTNGCAFLQAGTTAVDAALLDDLADKTTDPPFVLTGVLSDSVTLFPQAELDDFGAPSLGYHYAVLDWVMGGLLASNGSVNIIAGTAVGTCSSLSGYGLWLCTNAALTSQGTATSPAWIVRYNTVQEQSTATWSGGNPISVKTGSSLNASTPITCAFTDWSVLAGGWHIYAGPNDSSSDAFLSCQFYSGQTATYNPAWYVTNCLFRRVAFILSDTNGYSEDHVLYNNLFLNSAVENNHTGGGVWTYYDNLFDTTNITHLQSGDVENYNAFLNSSYTLLPSMGPHDQIITNSPAYQPGPLGPYYYPTNLSLIHAGSRFASAAGLSGYTVTTNNVVDGTNKVSIGFHYYVQEGASAGAPGATYYIDYASGNDTNNGTSTATPWKHHPFMNGWTTNAYTHHAGDQFIFKGGVTWSNSCFPLTISDGGTSSTMMDYYGVSGSWFAGSSWTRPIFNAGGMPVTNGTFNLFVFADAYNFILDNLEMTGFYWNSAHQNYGLSYIYVGTLTNIQIVNSYFHNWSHDSTNNGCTNQMAVINGSTVSSNPGCVCSNCVFDGSPNGTDSGQAGYCFPVFENCVARNMFSGFLPNSDPCVVSGCVIGPINASFVTNHHACGIEPQGIVGSVCLFNNIIHDSPEISLSIGGEAGVGQAWIYNNIIYNSMNAPIVLDGRYASANVVFIYNNVLDSSWEGTACIVTDTNATNPKWNFADVENNLMVRETDAGSYSNYVSSNNVFTNAAEGSNLLAQSTSAAPYFSAPAWPSLVGGLAADLTTASNLSNVVP